MMDIPADIDLSNVPKHIAIIMDGNGRWAKNQGKQRIFGHRKAMTAVKESVRICARLGVNYLTLYAFSTENWNRPKYEVNALMELLVNSLHNEIKELNENKIRIQSIGDIESLPVNCQRELQKSMELTSKNDKMTLVLALSYSSRWEIVNAVKIIAKKVQHETIDPDRLNEEIFSQHLTTCDIPDPELMIRTSGEYRLSNFLLWQLAYTELYFTKKLWPDMRESDIIAAIKDYQKRERRFGLTTEQLKAKNV